MKSLFILGNLKNSFKEEAKSLQKPRNAYIACITTGTLKIQNNYIGLLQYLHLTKFSLCM